MAEGGQGRRVQLGAQLIFESFALCRGKGEGALALFFLVFAKAAAVPGFDELEDFRLVLFGVWPDFEAGSKLFVQAMEDRSEIARHLREAAKQNCFPVRQKTLVESNPGNQRWAGGDLMERHMGERYGFGFTNDDQGRDLHFHGGDDLGGGVSVMNRPDTAALRGEKSEVGEGCAGAAEGLDYEIGVSVYDSVHLVAMAIACHGHVKERIGVYEIAHAVGNFLAQRTVGDGDRRGRRLSRVCRRGNITELRWIGLVIVHISESGTGERSTEFAAAVP